jgi:hypothetical protein
VALVTGSTLNVTGDARLHGAMSATLKLPGSANESAASAGGQAPAGAWL